MNPILKKLAFWFSETPLACILELFLEILVNTYNRCLIQFELPLAPFHIEGLYGVSDRKDASTNCKPSDFISSSEVTDDLISLDETDNGQESTEANAKLSSGDESHADIPAFEVTEEFEVSKQPMEALNGEKSVREFWETEYPDVFFPEQDSGINISFYRTEVALKDYFGGLTLSESSAIGDDKSYQTSPIESLQSSQPDFDGNERLQFPDLMEQSGHFEENLSKANTVKSDTKRRRSGRTDLESGKVNNGVVHDGKARKPTLKEELRNKLLAMRLDTEEASIKLGRSLALRFDPKDLMNKLKKKMTKK